MANSLNNEECKKPKISRCEKCKHYRHGTDYTEEHPIIIYEYCSLGHWGKKGLNEMHKMWE